MSKNPYFLIRMVLSLLLLQLWLIYWWIQCVIKSPLNPPPPTLIKRVVLGIGWSTITYHLIDLSFGFEKCKFILSSPLQPWSNQRFCNEECRLIIFYTAYIRQNQLVLCNLIITKIYSQDLSLQFTYNNIIRFLIYYYFII